MRQIPVNTPPLALAALARVRFALKLVRLPDERLIRLLASQADVHGRDLGHSGSLVSFEAIRISAAIHFLVVMTNEP
jgi:hypothetical protein